MKKLFLSLSAMAVVSFIATASNNDVKNADNTDENSNVELTYNSGNKLKLTVLDDAKGAVDISVRDKSTGLVVAGHSQSYDKSFALLLDMSSKDAGQYEFTIKGKDFELQQDVFISPLNEIDVIADIQETGDRVYNVKVFHDDIPVILSVENAKGRIMHKYVHSNSSNFQKEINLKNFDQNEELFIRIKGLKTSIYEAL